MNIDRYIEIMLVNMYPRHKVSITTVQYYDADKARVNKVISIQITNQDGIRTKIKCYNNRKVIKELIKWHSEEGD